VLRTAGEEGNSFFLRPARNGKKEGEICEKGRNDEGEYVIDWAKREGEGVARKLSHCESGLGVVIPTGGRTNRCRGSHKCRSCEEGKESAWAGHWKTWHFLAGGEE